MSLAPKLETMEGKIEQEIARLNKLKSTLSTQGQKISGWFKLLLTPDEIKAKKGKLDQLFMPDSKSLSGGIALAKNKLKQELSHLDLKFSGGKKGAKSNREVALQNIFRHLESLKTQINNLEKEQQTKYLETPVGRDQYEREVKSREKFNQEILSSLSPISDLNNIDQVRINPRHLELAGLYGVESTQGAILTAWKKMVADLLLNNRFKAVAENIGSFKEHRDFSDNFSDNNEKFRQIKESVLDLKSLEKEAVLALADIIAKNPSVKQRLHNYGIVGVSLNPQIQKILTQYDDLAISQIAVSPAALAYEYLHHLLTIITDSENGHDNLWRQLANLFSFKDERGKHYSSADVFGEKYGTDDLYFSSQHDYDLEFLSEIIEKLKKVFLTLPERIKSEGADIDPQLFIARFGRDNYSVTKDLPKLSNGQIREIESVRKYVSRDGSLVPEYYQDEALFNQFDVQNKQAEDKLSRLLHISWLEEELKQKYQNNPTALLALENKIRLVNYLKFLEKNREYHAGQSIQIQGDANGKIELLDNDNRRSEVERQREYLQLERDYKEYLKKEIALIVSEINKPLKKIFESKEQSALLNQRLATCQLLSSHSLADRIFGRIKNSDFHFFNESSLTPEEIQVIKKFSELGLENRREQENIRNRYRAMEKDLNRYPERLDINFLKGYHGLVDNISTYENLISNLKLINVSLSSFLREKYHNLIADLTLKTNKYRELIGDYNRRYHREGDGHLVSVFDFPDDLSYYL